MRLVITKLSSLLVFCLLSLPMLMAQIPNTSPFPVDVFFSTEQGFFREFDYVSTSDFGVNLSQTVSAEVAWAHDDGMYDEDGDGMPDSTYVDSLNCSWGTTMDLTGKIALIRRGACFFSQKIYNAQQAGAIGAVVINTPDGSATAGMAGADSADVAIIPAVFLSYEDGQIIDERIANGETVTATFQVRAFFGAIGPQAFKTPQSQVRPLSAIQAQALNLDTANAVLNPTATVVITAPNGNETTLTSTLDSISAASSGTFEFEDYTPGPVGEYTMKYYNSLSEDSLERTFHVSEHTFQLDEGNLPTWPTDSWIIESYDAFLEAGLRYDFGNMFYTGASESIAAFATFSIANPDSLYTGDAESDIFYLTLYDMDPDGDGIGPVGDEATYEEAGAQMVAQTSYVLTGTEIPYQILTVPFEEPVTLKANGQYLLMAEYDGVSNASGIPPYYSYSGTDVYPGITSVTFTDQLHLEGFGDVEQLTMEGLSSSFHAVVRLHLDGFTDTENFQTLDAHKVTLMPNPAKDHVNLQFNLDNNADEVIVNLISMQGQLMESMRLQNVLNETHRIDVDHLPAGTYFFGILTPEGYKAQKFVVVK